jgi:hypothetical protein
VKSELIEKQVLIPSLGSLYSESMIKRQLNVDLSI